MLTLRSYLLIRKIAEKRKFMGLGAHVNSDPVEPEITNVVTADEKPTTKKKGRFADWLSSDPEPINLYDGETELFRKGLVLVTDTRLAYVDPFDRMLKTFMFEHMISTHKQFYKPSDLNRRLCKGLLIVSSLVLLIILIIDLLDNNSGKLFLVYIPLIAAIIIGTKVWYDMKPRYVLHWAMRDMTYGEISQEPYLKERVLGNYKREKFMIELADAMNHALARKSWWPHSGKSHSEESNAANAATGANAEAIEFENDNGRNKPTLTLVTDSYQ